MNKISYLFSFICFIATSQVQAELIVINVPDGGTVAYESTSDQMAVQDKNGNYVVFDADANDGDAFDEVLEGLDNNRTVIPDTDDKDTISKGKDKKGKKNAWQWLKSIFSKEKGIIDGCGPEMDDWLGGGGGSPFGPIVLIPNGRSPVRGSMDDLRRLAR